MVRCTLHGLHIGGGGFGVRLSLLHDVCPLVIMKANHRRHLAATGNTLNQHPGRLQQLSSKRSGSSVMLEMALPA
jgi:hypothetical protein